MSTSSAWIKEHGLDDNVRFTGVIKLPGDVYKFSFRFEYGICSMTGVFNTQGVLTYSIHDKLPEQDVSVLSERQIKVMSAIALDVKRAYKMLLLPYWCCCCLDVFTILHPTNTL